MFRVHLFNSQNATQTFIADISAICSVDDLTFYLNDVDTISVEIDADAWLEYCQQSGVDPLSPIQPYTSEIKIKYNGQYLPAAFEIKRSSRSLKKDKRTINLNGMSTLSKLEDRLITKTYSSVDPTTMVRDMITISQAKTGGDFGITFADTYTTGVPSDRTYERYDIKQAIMNLSDDISGGFDFYFDHDWSLHTMSKRGSLKSLDLTYGGELSNVIEMDIPYDASSLSNAVYIVGEGIGSPIVSNPNTDTTSRAEYGLREKALSFPSIKNTDWLDVKSKTEVRDRKDIYDLPTVSVAQEVLDINDVFVGDTVNIQSSSAIAPYSQLKRIRRLSISLDNNFHAVYKLELMDD